MAIAIDTELAGEFSNSYVDVAYADDFWENHYSTTKSDTWLNTITDDQKIILLIQACRVLETVRFTDPGPQISDYIERYDRRTHTVKYYGIDTAPSKYYYYQALQFPRNFDRDTTDGSIYVPEPVLLAQCEQAMYSYAFDEGVLANKLMGLTRETITIDTLKVQQAMNSLGSSLSPVALEYLRPFMLKKNTSIRRG